MKKDLDKFVINEMIYSKGEGNTAIPIQFEFPVTAHSQYNNDYCKKTIVILKILILSALLILLGWTCTKLYTNYHLESLFLVDNLSAHTDCAEYDKKTLNSNLGISNQNAALNITSENIPTVPSYYDYSDKNNFKITFKYGIKRRVARKADVQVKEGDKEEEFKKWLESLDAKDLFSNINENPKFKTDLKRFIDVSEQMSDDVGILFTQVIMKYRHTVEIYMKNFVEMFKDAENDFKIFNSTAKFKSNK